MVFRRHASLFKYTHSIVGLGPKGYPCFSEKGEIGTSSISPQGLVWKKIIILLQEVF